MTARQRAIAVLESITKLDIDDGFDADALIIDGTRYSIGAVANNQFLKLSGNSIIGAAVGSGGNWWETELPENESVSGLVPDYSAGSGMPSGSQLIIRLQSVDDGLGNIFDVLQIGDKNGPLGSEIIFDPYWLGAFYLQPPIVISDQPYSPISEVALSGFWARYNETSVSLGYEDHTTSEWYRDHLKLRADLDNNNPSFLSLENASESETVLIKGDGTTVFVELPTTVDPAVDGQLFTCTAAELAALLGAGAKHVLMSKGT
jgi:hypothetical protein